MQFPITYYFHENDEGTSLAGFFHTSPILLTSVPGEKARQLWPR